MLSNQDEKARQLLNHKETIKAIKDQQKELIQRRPDQSNQSRSRQNY
jgi:hypothetical protein